MNFKNVETLQHELLSASFVRHGFFKRQGGVSQGVFASLNTAYSNGDNREYVAENRKRAMEHLGLSPDHMVVNKQIHSNKAIFVDAPRPLGQEEQADGLVTTYPNLALCVYGADCPPVLFLDAQAKVIGACHAGWKGALSGIIESTIALMIEKGSKRDQICAVIGPSIAQSSYEVGQDFQSPFIVQDPQNKRFFVEAKRKEHLFFDLKAYCASRLEQAHIKAFAVLDQDTYAQSLDFFSYRRTCHMSESQYGNNLNMICLI